MKNSKLLLFLKYIFLIFLVFLLVVQALKLWLDIPKYSMLFDLVSSNEENLAKEQNVSIALPSTVGIKDEDCDCYYVMNNKVKGYSDFLESCKNIIAAGIRNKPFTQIDSEDFDFSKPYTIIVYPFSVSKNLLLNVYSVSDNGDFPDYVDYILIETSKDDRDNNKVYFHSSVEDVLYGHKVSYEEAFIDLDLINYNRREKIYDSNIQYDLSLDSGEGFKSMFLVPRNNKFAVLNYKINPYIPFFDEEELKEEELYDFILPFFGDRKSVKKTTVDNQIIFIENEAVLKYDKTGLLEYIEGVNQELAQNNFILDFSAGVEFINKKIDKGLVEYYLSNYAYDVDGLHIYYDIGYNGIKWEFDSIYSKYAMRYPMEVIVKNGKVVKLKWILRFMPEIIQQAERINLSYVDNFKTYYDENLSNFEEVELTYKISDDQSSVLNWLFEKSDGKYFIEVESE